MAAMGYAKQLLSQPMVLWNKLKYRSFLPAVTCIGLALSADDQFVSMEQQLLNNPTGETEQFLATRAVLSTIFSAILIFVTVPLTHYCLGKRKHSTFYFYHPFDGGVKYVVLQAIGWAIYSIAVLLCLVRLVQTKMNIPLSIPMYIPAVGNLLALLVLISSFFYFEHESLSSNRETSRSQSARGVGITIAVFPLVIFTILMLSATNYVNWVIAAVALFLCVLYVRYRVYGTIQQFSMAWNNVGVLGLVLVSLSMICAACVELMARYGKDRLELHLGREDGSLFVIQIPSTAIALLATALFLVAVPLTHGVAGKKMHRGYRSWQPFSGGSKYVCLQGVAWAIYSISAVLAVHFLATTFGSSWSFENLVPIVVESDGTFHRLQLQNAVVQNAQQELGKLSSVLPFRGIMASMTAGGFFSQCLVLISLFFFDPSTEKERLVLKWRVSKWHKSFSSTVLSAVLYSVHWIWLFSCLACLGLLPLQYSATILVAFHAPYLLTFRGTPHLTGSRQWPRLQNSEWIWNTIQHYFSGTIVQHSGKPLDPEQHYVFGFHPHGIYPVTILWSLLCSDWKKIYAGSRVTTLGATIMFYTPFMRDVISWLGTLDVRRSNIEKLLDEKKPIMLVPGGQAEMFAHTSHPATVVLSRKHKGFIHLAITRGVPLVPVFSFGENQILDNIGTKGMQRWFIRHLKLNPSFPYGRWYLPFPRRVRVTVVVGDPIETERQENPSEEYVNSIYQKYFAHLQEMFERHKADAGFPDSQLLFADDY